jgi:hypothetical protein
MRKYIKKYTKVIIENDLWIGVRIILLRLLQNDRVGIRTRFTNHKEHFPASFAGGGAGKISKRREEPL